MVNKKDFIKYIQAFQNEFDEKYTDLREEMLYKKLQGLEETLVDRTLTRAIGKFNKSNLPSIDDLEEIALSIYYADIEDFNEMRNAI